MRSQECGFLNSEVSPVSPNGKPSSRRIRFARQPRPTSVNITDGDVVGFGFHFSRLPSKTCCSFAVQIRADVCALAAENRISPRALSTCIIRPLCLQTEPTFLRPGPADAVRRRSNRSVEIAWVTIVDGKAERRVPEFGRRFVEIRGTDRIAAPRWGSSRKTMSAVQTMSRRVASAARF